MKTEYEYRQLEKENEELKAQIAKLTSDLAHQHNAYDLLAQAVRNETASETARTRRNFRWLKP